MVRIKTTDILRPLTDNEYSYIDFIRIFVEHGDPNAQAELKRNSEGYVVRITPSQDDLKKDLIKDIIEAHRRLGLKVTFSKSLSKQKTITFCILL